MRNIRERFSEQIDHAQSKVTELASFVTEMLTLSMQALVNQDEKLADQVIHMDDVADDLDLEIEQACMRLLALQQPMAKDLRIISTAMRISGDYERVGDYSVDIARSARALASEPYFKPLVDIPRMAEITEEMVRDSAAAFVNHDLELVSKVVAQDDEIDHMWYTLLSEIISLMEQDPSVVRQATHLLLVARYLERIADHVVNVAERVSYMETGHFEDLVLSHSPDYRRP